MLLECIVPKQRTTALKLQQRSVCSGPFPNADHVIEVAVRIELPSTLRLGESPPTFGSAGIVFPNPSEPCTKSAIRSLAAPIELKVAPWDTGTCESNEQMLLGSVAFQKVGGSKVRDVIIPTSAGTGHS